MAAYQRKSTRQPAPVLYDTARALVRFFCRVFLGYRVRYHDPVPKTGPLLVLGSHAGMLDSLFMAAAVGNRRLNFVTTERFFRVRWVAAVFRRLGVIPRIQFQADPRSISAMLRVMRDGGAVGLFPAGQTSLCGVPSTMPDAVAKLVRRSGATVLALRLHGSFFTKSRFQSGFNRGRVEGEVSVLFTPEQLAAASDAEIYRAVCDALWYDEYAWQARTGARYRGRNRARGYEKILYLCPKCGARHQMYSQGHRFCCAACGNAARVGPDMRMHADGQDSVVYPTLREWFDRQAGEIYAAIDARDTPFLMEEPAALELWSGAQPRPLGDGVLRLDREHLAFEGDGPAQEASFALAHRSLFGIAAEVGSYLELYHPTLGPVRLRPENPGAVASLKIAQEYLHAKTIDL